MKIAFHFNPFHPSLGSNYGDYVEEIIFNILLSCRNLSLSSKILTGDLLLSKLASGIKKTKTGESKQKDYSKVVHLWLQPDNTVWSSMIIPKLIKVLKQVEIFTICFETIEMQLADYLDDKLQESCEAYLGAMEVDDASYVHWVVYSNTIGLRYRINNKNASIFWDGFNEESKDESQIERLKEFGFKRVDF